jgi:hypothetical protein
VAQVVEHLLLKFEAVSSNPHSTKKKTKNKKQKTVGHPEPFFVLFCFNTDQGFNPGIH